MKVLLEKGVWLTDDEGDPPRTLIERYAKEFPDKYAALKALEAARNFRPFPNAELQEDFI